MKTIKVIHSSLDLAIGTQCPYCGTTMTATPRPRNWRWKTMHNVVGGPHMATREHVYPRSRGGRLVIITCAKCNNEKGDMTPFEWIEHLYNTGRNEIAQMVIRTYLALDKGIFRSGAKPVDIIEKCNELYALQLSTRNNFVDEEHKT